MKSAGRRPNTGPRACPWCDVEIRKVTGIDRLGKRVRICENCKGVR